VPSTGLDVDGERLATLQCASPQRDRR